MDPIEQRVRDSLRARADDIEPTPALYRGVQARIARRRRFRAVTWSLAGAAAVAVAAVAVPNLLGGADPRQPEVADAPDPVDTPGAELPRSDGDPEHALLALTDGSLVVADLATGDRRELYATEGRIVQLSAAPGGTVDGFRAAATIADAGEAALVALFSASDATYTSSLDLPGGSGATPQVAISPDGDWLAYTGISQLVDAAPAVYVVPVEDDGTLAVDASQEVHTVTVADELDAIDTLVEWSGATSTDGDQSRLQVRGDGTPGALVLERVEGGFEVQQRETDDGLTAGALDVSSDFVSASAGPVFRLEAGEDDDPQVRFGDTTASTGQLGTAADDVQLDARGRTALLSGGGSAVTVRFPASGTVVESELLGDDIITGALLGGAGPADAEPTEAPTEGDEEVPTGTAGIGGGLVIADDTTVSLVRADGSIQELVTFPAEGESSVVGVAVRPGSTETDLTVAITTRAEASYDVRWLRVVDGEVDTAIDPVGTDFPAPAIEGPDGFLLGVPDLLDGSEPAAAWSPDGDLLVVTARPGPGELVQARTIGWTDDGPSQDPNLAASFDVSERPLTVRRWYWLDDTTGGGTAGDGDGTARAGQLLLVDPLAREAFTLRFDRQADGAPAMPADVTLEPVAGDRILDVGDTDGDGRVDAVLRTGDAGPVLELNAGIASAPDEPVDVPLGDVTGPRDVSHLVVGEGFVLVALDPTRAVIVDLSSAEVTAVPFDHEVVSAGAIGAGW